MAQPETITHPDDPRLAPYANVRDRDLAMRDGLFLIEGQLALERAIDRGRFPLHSVLLADHRREPLAGLIARCPAPVYLASQQVMDAVAGFAIHRGVLAAGRRADAAGSAALLSALGSHAVVIGLVGVVDADNVGATFRNAAAFGADAVLLDASSCDPLYRKAIRTSAGYALTLPFARGDTGEGMIDALEADGFHIWALSPHGGEDIRALVAPSKLALILGAEGDGLPEALMQRCRRVTIPMAAGVDSLNVATAGAVALSHLRR